MTFAVIKTGGKQYKVAANDVVKIEKIAGEPGDVVTFDQILMVGDGDTVTVGAPLVEGALVAAHFVATEKQRTVIIQKKHRRQHFDRRNGHRQLLTTVRIAEILIGGGKVTVGPDEIAKARYAAKQQGAVSVSSDEAKPAKAAKIAKPAKTTAKAAAKADNADAPAKAPAKKAAAKKAAVEIVDDLKLIGGVGPAIEKKLHEAGITSLKEIAAWKAADIADFDEKLAFHGRIEREDWVGQAADLLAGKPPRAKADQEALAEEKAAAKQKKPAAKKAPKADDNA
ncbi:MAG TPA: 50S ribosomal protein L21 [Devosia sp.]|nr:50S ribosomal protein L21 [Devosia sp.]